MYLVFTCMPGESDDVPLEVRVMMYLWRSLCTLYLFACQVRVMMYL